MRVAAYVVHTRPFQDNKVLLDLFSQELGLIRGVWRLPKKEARVTPGPFLRYDIELSGRSDLKTLVSMESTHSGFSIQGNHLYAALYVHELLAKLVVKNAPLEDLFILYEWLLSSLQTEAPLAPLLRRFESGLFDELSAGINMSYTSTGELIKSAQLYRFDVRFGLRAYHGETLKQLPLFFVQGGVALAYAAGQWGQKSVLMMAKELHRHWLDYLMNGKPIEARRLLPKQIYQGERHLTVPMFRSLEGVI
jgi:DNA repair protein RecO (recombination protein O)